LQRPQPAQHTPFTREKHPCPRRYSNPPFQQASGRRPKKEGEVKKNKAKKKKKRRKKRKKRKRKKKRKKKKKQQLRQLGHWEWRVGLSATQYSLL